MVKNTRGVTLIELMIVVAIVGAVVSMGPNLLTQVNKFFILGRTRLELQREARSVMYLLTREIRQAQSNTIVMDQITGQPYYSRITFNKIQGPLVTIAQTGSNLTITEGTNKSTLTTHLAYVGFTFPHSDDMTIVSVSITLQEQIYGLAYKALHMASERVRVMD